MNNNDLILLNQLLNQRIAEVGAGLTEPEFFELFCAEQVLKDYDLSYEEIFDGIIDNGGDGGIDSIYFFINDSLYNDEYELSEFKRNVNLKLVIIQSKTSTGFSETGIEKLISTLRDLLDLSKSLENFTSVYNKELLKKVGIFRDVYIGLTSKFPNLSFEYYYVTKGSEIHPNVKRKVDVLKELVKSIFSSCDSKFEFIGASNLLGMARKTQSTAHDLNLAETPISTGKVGYIVLVNIKEFYNFITDETGKLKKIIFEGNVRDYQGKNEVNEHIADTLKETGYEDFWWLNNGVSIICTKAPLSAKTLTLENPEIVNGLQTSTEIYKHFSSNHECQDSRNILIRVLVPEDETSRDRIIKATNSQTPIPVASLRATDKIHRDLEEYFLIHGLFYDRRKNYYKNIGKPIKNIVGIAYMAQAVLACVLLDPSSSRSRPSSLLKEDDTYLKIFSLEYPLELYLKCVQILRIIEVYLRTIENLNKTEINNIKFHLSMFITLTLTGKIKPTPMDISNIDLSNLTNKLLGDCFQAVYRVYQDLGSTDQVAKNRKFSLKVLEVFEESIKSSVETTK